MTTLEKLFVQIFDRKNWIIEQVQQQADSYTQQLASRLLIDGITPPPWLLNPNFNSHSSDPYELEKEDIISELLLRPPQDSTRYSTGGHSLYYRPVAAGGNINKPLSTKMCMETHAPNKDINLSNEPNLTLGHQNNDTVSSLDHVPELEDNAKSPRKATDARIRSIYAAPDMSLARIQRSKSRQKARELRSNAKICSSNENRTHLSFSGDSKSKKVLHQDIQDKCPSDTSKRNHVSKTITMAEEGNDGTSHSHRLAKSNSSCDIPSLGGRHNKIRVFSDKEEFDGGIMVEPTCDLLQQSCNVNGVMEGVNLPDACLGSYAGKNTISEKKNGSQSQSNLFCGRITRSRSSRQQTSGINKFSKLGTSVSCNTKDGGAPSHLVDDLMHELNISNKLADGVETSQVPSDINAETQATYSNEGVLKPVISPYIDMKESPHGANHKENAEIIVGNRPIDEPVATQPVNSGAKLDPVTFCMESEGLALRQSSDCCMNVKPKQLNFDECNVNEIFSSRSKKRKLNGLSGKEYYPSKESESSIDHKSSCIEQQLPKANGLPSSPENRRAHCYNNIDEIAKDEMKNIGLDINENPVVEGVLDNSKFSQHGDIDATCDVNTSLKEVNNKFDVEINSEKCHLNTDQASAYYMQTNEDDSRQKGKESAASVHIPVSNIKSSFTTSLTKQGNNGFEDCLDQELNEPEVDLYSSKSKESEVGTNAKLLNMKVNSVKVNASPLNQQKNVEHQPNSLSDSQNFRVHIQRNTIRCDLETAENGLNLLNKFASRLSSEKTHLTQSDVMQSVDRRVHDDVICDLPERIESLLEIQAAKEIVAEADDVDSTEITDTLKQSKPTCDLNLIKNAADDSTYSLEADVGPANSSINGDVAVTDNNNLEINLPERVSSYISIQSSQKDDKTMVESDKITPVYEGFIIDDDIGNVNLGYNEGGIDFDALEVSSTTIARASIIEQICKSSSMQTPLSQLSSTFQQHQVQGLYGYMADGILDQMDLGTTVFVDEDSGTLLHTSDNNITKIDSIFSQHQKFDFATPFDWQSKNHYSSPVGKLWDRSASSSGSSEIQLSSNPDLTCFPIEEDPNGNEENENIEEMHEIQENKSTDTENESLVRVSSEMKVERRENEDEVVVEIPEPPIQYTEVCTQNENFMSKSSLKYPDRYSSNSGIEVSVPRTHDKVKHKPKIHHEIKVSRYENRDSSIITRASSRGNVSVNSNNKGSMISGLPRLLQKDAKRNNIVSNITSFVPIVQQKLAAAVCTGKRDIKVKALEAAEAAKRREQEKENERKLKKEALKLERERIGKENAKERELNMKKQDLKKKEADIAARKRQREEEERKLLAKKRKLVAEIQKNQKVKYEKARIRKLESAKKVKNAGAAGNKKKSENLRQVINADENSFQKQDTESKIDKTLANVSQQVMSVPVPESHDASNDCSEKDKVTNAHEMSPVKVIPVKLTSQENSYDISPYQCSDDEDDDEEDDLRPKKFIPSWASKNRVAMVLPLQQKLDPESIFSVDSFCSTDEDQVPPWFLWVKFLMFMLGLTMGERSQRGIGRDDRVVVVIGGDDVDGDCG
ncbi:hypothetical protein E3N88_08676 [Mikania micrantha]|uniref:Inner centromere protein ARK-binding domain-containing protein n=1 Tax=Mikania micrantha TaxID=192012 RepID=A0A5N6PGV9_9ASTR|nr:hypothetical protein E3N88_08676 [Mikania micrantha]